MGIHFQQQMLFKMQVSQFGNILIINPVGFCFEKSFANEFFELNKTFLQWTAEFCDKF